MKSPREPILPTWLARALMASLVLIIALMPIHAFISTWGGTAVGPLWLWKSWKEILLGVLVVMVLGWLVANKAAWSQLVHDRLAQVMAAYVALSLVLSVLHIGTVGSAAASAGVAMNLRYLAIAALAYVLFRFSKHDWFVVGKKVVAFVVGVGIALSTIGVLQVTVLPVDLLANFGYDKDATIAPFMTIDENPDALRAFATLRGPNDYGAFLTLPLVLAFLYIKRPAYRIAAMLTIAAGLAVSVSRSAWIGAVLALLVAAALTYGPKLFRSKRFIYSAVVSAVVFVGLIVSAMSVPSLRLAIFRSSPGDTSLTEGSTDQHVLATAAGIMRVVNDPLGCGVGCSGPASYYGGSARISENYYVQLAEEVGVLGLGLWLTIAWLVTERLYRLRQDLLARALLASFVGISSIGLLLHVWSDDPLSLTWWGLAGAVLGYYASAWAKKPVR